MPVTLKNLAGTTTLTNDSVDKWLGNAGYPVPEHLDAKCIEQFLSSRNKTYGFLQQQTFLSDIEGFYQARRGIKIALKNLDGYEASLANHRVTDTLVLQVLDYKSGKKPSDEVMDFVRQQISEVLREEWTYVRECRESLEEQWRWHHTGSVDKGALSPVAVNRILKQFSDQTTAYKEQVQKAQEQAKKPKGKGASGGGQAEPPPVMPKPPTEKDRAKYAYYDPIRNRLMSLGFVVSPPGTALGAVFPEKDWIKGVAGVRFNQEVKAYTDALAARYHLIGDDETSLTRLLMARHPQWAAMKEMKSAFVSAVGCLCVSWTRHTVAGRTVHVPILGLSGVVQEEPGPSYFQKYCRHLGLPNWQPDPSIPAYGETSLVAEKFKTAQALMKREEERLKKLVPQKAPKEAPEVQALQRHRASWKVSSEKLEQEKAEFQQRKSTSELANELNVNYETMIERTNLVALGYRARTLLRLRTPARQALFSYVSFRQDKSHDDLSVKTLQDVKLGVDLWVCGWHSLNCAEPAALMTASSYFAEGCDVLVCFPYEGLNDAGTGRNRPKETCPWCAAVELGFRSLSENKGKVPTGLSTGAWLTQLTLTLQDEPDEVLPVNRGFDAFQDDNSIMTATRMTLAGDDKGLVKNSDLESPAYSSVVMTKIGRLRSMYHLLGLIDREVVALDRQLYPHAGFGVVSKFLK
ncbi:hypothetical protein HJC22_10740 [Corallococcus exiguus]|uniref:hypothetical protein n=1 Tax=Corallococcus TaxID=83461 RepID=UPI000ECEB2D6|nr:MULTISPECIES: hypothetical protein [Corallococcus]NNC16201.1 hypothetical protein [Corallococcus exiguus]NRD54968.1 hypothetical protein [Corallococcus exiguus]RKI08934.1 hypothetical protein D7Y15_24795 [Corallococcus sp. AB030]RUO89433.1 hypothetical protein D7Y11_30280 [Corallococcus sp. AB018]